MLCGNVLTIDNFALGTEVQKYIQILGSLDTTFHRVVRILVTGNGGFLLSMDVELKIRKSET